MAQWEIAGLLFIGFVAAILAVPLGLIVLVRRSGRKRSQPLAAQAAALGFAFSAGRVRDLPAALLAHPLLAGGIDAKAYDALRGEFDGHQLIVFDHASLRSLGAGVCNDRQHGFIRHIVVAVRPAAPMAAAAAARFPMSDGWIVHAAAGDGTPGERMQRLRAAAQALGAASADLGAALHRALNGKTPRQG